MITCYLLALEIYEALDLKFGKILVDYVRYFHDKTYSFLSLVFFSNILPMYYIGKIFET